MLTFHESDGGAHDLVDVLLEREVADGERAERRLQQTVHLHLARLHLALQAEPAHNTATTLH